MQQSPVGSEAAYHVLPLKLALPWVWSLLGWVRVCFANVAVSKEGVLVEY